MSGTNIFLIVGAVASLFLGSVRTASAQYLLADKPVVNPSIASAEDAEYERDAASLTQLTAGNKWRPKPDLRTMLRRAEREWPRLLLRYAQPAVRGLLADRQNGSNTLSVRTTLFRDNSKGLHLAGGFGRNSWGEREARLQFSARF